MQKWIEFELAAIAVAAPPSDEVSGSSLIFLIAGALVPDIFTT